MGVVETFYIPKGDGRHPIYFANGVKACIDIPEFMGINAISIDYEPTESQRARLRKRYKKP